MSGVSLQLLAFAVAAAILYNLRPTVVWRQAVLFVVNVLFLASFSRDLLTWLPLLAFLAIGYAGVHLLQAGVHRAFWPFLGGTIAAFIWLKKYAFLPHALFLRPMYVVIGLSYIFFRVLHLMIEIRAGSLKERIGPASYLNYLLNFTTLVSGPIQRFRDFAATHLRASRPSLDIFMIGDAAQRIIVGCFKVTVLSQLFSLVQERSILHLAPGQGPLSSALTGAVIAGSYPVYLYCNFSGYMDVMIGLARLFRFELPENFDRPFSALNFIDFWNRWHITLSSWLKSYVYNPLLIVLMRRIQSSSAAPLLGVIAYFVTFFLIGIWHGQTSEFVAYGVVLGLGVSINKLFQVVTAKILGRERNRSLNANPVYNALSRGLTFTWFSFSLTFFWSSWKQMDVMLRQMSYASVVAAWLIIFAAATIVLAAYEIVRNRALSFGRQDFPILSSRYARVVYCTTLAFASIVVIALANMPAPTIVYQTF